MTKQNSDIRFKNLRSGFFFLDFVYQTQNPFFTACVTSHIPRGQGAPQTALMRLHPVLVAANLAVNSGTQDSSHYTRPLYTTLVAAAVLPASLRDTM